MANRPASTSPHTTQGRSFASGRRHRYVVIGGTVVAQRVCGTLGSDGDEVVHLVTPSDEDLSAAMAKETEAVAILLHDDTACLRYALAVAHRRPKVRLIVSIFDQTVAEQLSRVLPSCVIASPADIAVPTLTAACLEPDLMAVWPHTADGRVAVSRGDDGFVLRTFRLHRPLRWRARLGRVRGQLRPHDGSSRSLLAGLAGLATILVLDWVWLVVGLHQNSVSAFYDAVRVVATVGPAAAEHTPLAYQLFAGTAMLATIVFTAVFTAGVVHRLLHGPSFGLIGHRAPPRDGHVIVVGLGQVGLRLCLALRDLGVAVVAVERNPAARNLRSAKEHRIPVLIANGGDYGVLARLNLRRAVALCAVGSDDLDNIAVGVTAMAGAPGLRVVLRAGNGESITETRSLFKIGEVRDVTALSATHVVLALRRQDPTNVFSDGLHVYATLDTTDFVDCTTSTAAGCQHATTLPAAA